jgi:hypothetical protein
MANKKATIKPVKSVKVNMRLRDDLRHKVDYLMLFPGGLTKWVEDRLDEVTVDEKLFKRMTGK